MGYPYFEAVRKAEEMRLAAEEAMQNGSRGAFSFSPRRLHNPLAVLHHRGPS
jgi:hypothetical protein